MNMIIINGFFVKNKLVGRLRITHIKDEDLCSISEFLIDESYRGKGIGKQLLKYIINKYGNHDMVLNVAADNTIAKDLYFNNGFRITYTNNTPELGEPFYVMSRPGRNIKGEIKMDSVLVDSDAIRINGGGLDGIAVTVTYNITDVKEPMTRDEVINIVGADTILNDLNAEYERNGKKMPNVTMDGVDSYFAPDGNRLIAEFTLDDYFEYE